jgi:hypothetical protein
MLASWNALVCLALSVVCWSFLLASHGEGRLERLNNVVLLLAAVAYFVAALAPFAHAERVAWWTLLARTCAALIAGVMYHDRFGIGAQARALLTHFLRIPERVRASIARIRAHVHLVRQ